METALTGKNEPLEEKGRREFFILPLNQVDD